MYKRLRHSYFHQEFFNRHGAKAAKFGWFFLPELVFVVMTTAQFLNIPLRTLRTPRLKNFHSFGV